MRGWFIILLILTGCSKGGSTPPVVEPPQTQCMAYVLWETPTTRINGEVLANSDIAKTTLFMSAIESTEDQYLESVFEITDGNTEHTINNLTRGEHWFYANVTTTDNFTSAHSNLMSKICP